MIFKTTQIDDLIIRQANISDFAAIVEMLKACAKWIQAKGIDQWGYLLEGGEDQEIEVDILAGSTYIIENENNELIATFNFSNKQNEWDVHMWGQRDDNAYYIHRLAVSPEHRGKQIGKRILAWIDENNTIQDGYIRLDCVENNPTLNNFYQDAGFQFIGHVDEGEELFSLYEKVLLKS